MLLSLSRTLHFFFSFFVILLQRFNEPAVDVCCILLLTRCLIRQVLSLWLLINSLHRIRLTLRLNHFYSLFANSVQKLVLISSRIARTHVSVSYRRVSYRFLMLLTIGPITTCAWRLGAGTCQNSQKIIYSKQWKSSSNLKDFLWTKKMLWGNSFKAKIRRLVFQRLPIAADTMLRILQSSRQF